MWIKDIRVTFDYSLSSYKFEIVASIESNHLELHIAYYLNQMFVETLIHEQDLLTLIAMSANKEYPINIFIWYENIKDFLEAHAATLQGKVHNAQKAVFEPNDEIRFKETSLGLPGMEERVLHPEVDEYCAWDALGAMEPLRNLIMHLNDRHRWSRGKIADWLDYLHESGQVDLAFKT